MSEKNRYPYLKQYRKDKLKRVEIALPREDYECKVLPIAESVGEPVATYIKNAIFFRMEKEERDRSLISLPTQLMDQITEKTGDAPDKWIEKILTEKIK